MIIYIAETDIGVLDVFASVKGADQFLRGRGFRPVADKYSTAGFEWDWEADQLCSCARIRERKIKP